MPPRALRATKAADPMYVKVAAEFRRQIENGVLRVGDKLPSIRVLRRGRRISAATAMEAYLRLERDGFVRARDRSGFYVLDPLSSRYPQPEASGALVPPVPVGISKLVAEVLQQTGNSRLVPLGVSTLGPGLLPIPRLNRAFRRALTRWPQHSAAYIGLKGHIALRRQIARRALASGSSSDPEDIIVTGGAMEALNLALRAVAQVGEVIAVESPTYFGVLQALEALGLRAIEVPADYYTGINIELLERAIRKHRVKAVLCMTTCHNPLGSVMSDERKRELVALTARYQVPLIEDGAYAELVYDETQRRPAKTFDREGLVLYCGSFSKALAPGLRVGWIEAGRFRDRVEALKGVTSLMTSTLPQLAIAELLECGFFQRHVNRLRIQVANQNAKYVQALGEVLPPGSRLTRPAGGIPVWVQLPKKVDGTLLYRRLLEENIGVFPGEVFSAGAKHKGFIRVSTGPAWSPAVERALGRIGRLASEMAR